MHAYIVSREYITLMQYLHINAVNCRIVPKLRKCEISYFIWVFLIIQELDYNHYIHKQRFRYFSKPGMTQTLGKEVGKQSGRKAF